MQFAVKEQSKEKYLEFINDITIKCAKELASINSLRQSSGKKVTFSESNKEAEKENIEPELKKFKGNTLKV